MTGALSIGNPEILVRIRRNAQARRMILRVGRPAGLATLTLPLSAGLVEARRFAEAQEGWMRAQIAAHPPVTRVAPGLDLPFEDRRLTIVQTSGRLRHDGDRLHVPEPVPGARVATFLRESARARLTATVDRHAAVLGVRPGRITLRDPRSRWGSCSSAGDLMFSWRLIMAPSAVLDYVAAHEVAHLRELNHEPRFWALVERLVPDHRDQRRWLRQNGSGLHAYHFGTLPTA